MKSIMLTLKENEIVVKRKADGYKVVLTAERTLMSEYAGDIFLGFSACVPRGLIPDKLYFSLFCPYENAGASGLVASIVSLQGGVHNKCI